MTKINILATVFFMTLSRENKMRIDKYLAGKELDTNNVNIDNLEGTEFQKKVWRALMAIPKGQTRSYKDIAISIGHPKAFRAVGSACGANPLAVLIPCHRAMGSNGSFGGFAWGLELKKELLEFEGVNGI